MKNHAKVVNIEVESYDVFIGRPSKWGNPFKIGDKYTRDQALQQYSQWIVNQDQLINDLHQLKGKILGCYCKPLSCHGDILYRLANAAEQSDIDV